MNLLWFIQNVPESFYLEAFVAKQIGMKTLRYTRRQQSKIIVFKMYLVSIYGDWYLIIYGWSCATVLSKQKSISPWCPNMITYTNNGCIITNTILIEYLNIILERQMAKTPHGRYPKTYFVMLCFERIIQFIIWRVPS